MTQFRQALIAAVQFLTRVPIPVEVPFTNEVLKRSTLFFPFAGVLVGLVSWGSGWLLMQVLPVMPAAVLTVLVMLAMTGGLHLDGLMDTADGILSHRSRERMLEIMKDSRVGAMGVIACVIILLWQWSLIASLMEQQRWSIAVVLPFIFSRYVMVWAIAAQPYARASESGLGSLFQGLSTRHVIRAAVMSFLLSVLLLTAELWVTGPETLHNIWFVLGYTAGMLLLAALLAYVLARAIVHKLGGLTGDTYGAICELVLTLLLTIQVAIYPLI
ncbi:adenosylcobinamide-GDP ribazoletransferase [Paenibacillus marinisediminis]